MRIAASVCVALACCAASFSDSHATLRHLSSRTFPGGGNEGISMLAVGATGDLYMIAGADSLLSFGDVNLGPGVFAVRLDATGAPVWTRPLYVSGDPHVRDMAPTPDGGLVLAGEFSGSVDFGGGRLTALDWDVFVVRFDATGATAWQRRFGNNLQQFARGVAVAANGDVIVTGGLYGTIDFGGGVIRNNGGDDMFVARLNAGGGHVWSRGYGQAGIQEGWFVDIGADGRIALGCRMSGGTIDFGGGPLTIAPGEDIGLAVLEGDGGHVWSRLLDSSGAQTATGMAFDGSGNLFLAANTSRGVVSVGDGHFLTVDANAGSFVTSYAPSGAYRWGRVIPDPVESFVTALATDPSGHGFVMVKNVSPIVLGDEELLPSLFLLVAYDSTGDVSCASGFGAPLSGSTAYLGTDDAGSIVLAGTLKDAIDFGNGPLRPESGTDAFLAKLAIRRPPDVTVTSFAARVLDVAVEVRWSLQSGEPLGTYFLRRRIDDAPSVYTVASGAAADGPHTFVDHTTEPGHVYTYELGVSTALGDEAFSPVVSVTVPTVRTELRQNAPNPFNPLTTIVYSLAAPAAVSIAIYDVSGAIIARLDQGMQPAGTHQATWGGHDAFGNVVSSGVYFYRLEGVDGAGARKMVLLK